MALTSSLFMALATKKQAAKRIQFKRALRNINTMQDFNKATKDFISSIKDKAAKEQALKFKADFEKKAKDLLKGDNFYMSKPEAKPAKSDLTISVAVDATLKKNLDLNADNLKAHLQKLKETHPESFKTYGSVARVIKAINDNPTHFIKNNRLDMELVGKFLENGKFGEMEIVTQGKNVGNVGHLLVTSKGNKRINSLNKRSENSAVETGKLQHTAKEKADGRTGTIDALSPNSSSNLPKKSLKANKKPDEMSISELAESLVQKGKTKEKQAKEWIENANEKLKASKEAKLKQALDSLKAKQKQTDDKINALNERAKYMSELENVEFLKNGDISFFDKKLKKHILTKKTQDEWLKTFNIKDLGQTYEPNFNENIKKALENKPLKLQFGSLKKLVSQGRETFIPEIKKVLDTPDFIVKDGVNAFVLGRNLKNDDYFVNVSIDKGDYLVSISNSIKETRNIKNKLKNGAILVYQSPNFKSNSQKLLQGSQSSPNKTDKPL